ncbi:hypothetical protein [Haladaptatus sp. NG-SE-30]
MPDSTTGDSEWEVVEVNVGFQGKEGREAAVDCSVAVVREFESLDIVTIQIPREKWSELADHPGIRYVEANGQTGAPDT